MFYSEKYYPRELDRNVPDNIPSSSNLTCSSSNSKRVAVAHSEDKRAITITLAISFSNEMLPFQMIYQGKTPRCLPDKSLLPSSFLLSYNPTHWSNTEETIKLLDKIIVEKRNQLGLPDDQKCVLIWDDFRAHTTDEVITRARALNCEIVEVPKNLTHLLAPLDLTVNKSLKSFEQRELSKYWLRNPKLRNDPIYGIVP
eukprot:sb/3470789/